MSSDKEPHETKRSRRRFVISGILAFAAGLTALFLGRDRLLGPPQPPKSFTDEQITAEMVSFQGEAGMVSAYQAKPKFDSAFPAVIIIHENAGLLSHFKDVSKRFAKEGYVAAATDFLSRVGGSGNDENDNRVRQGRLKDAEIQSDIDSTVRYLKSQPFVKGSRIAVGPGFCWGGRQSLIAGLRSRELAACVTYYGFPVLARPSETQTINPMELVPNSVTPIIAHFGEADRAIPLEQVEQLKRALESNKKDFELYVYPAAGHAFFNDSRPPVFKEDAAKISWERTLAFLEKRLKA